MRKGKEVGKPLLQDSVIFADAVHSALTQIGNLFQSSDQLSRRDQLVVVEQVLQMLAQLRALPEASKHFEVVRERLGAIEQLLQAAFVDDESLPLQDRPARKAAARGFVEGHLKCICLESQLLERNQQAQTMLLSGLGLTPYPVIKAASPQAESP